MGRWKKINAEVPKYKMVTFVRDADGCLSAAEWVGTGWNFHGLSGDATEWYDEFDEDPQEICNALCKAFRVCCNADLDGLVYDDQNGMVTAYHNGNVVRVINVNGDSGLAMIKDIANHLY